MSVAENHHPDWKQAQVQRLFGPLLGPAALLAIVILFNWKLVLTNRFTWLESPDIAHQVLPWFQFQAGEWHAGRFPLWDPNDWAGQTLFGQLQPGSAYPLNWLLFLAPLKNGWMQIAVLHWYLMLIRYIGALTAFALCRDLGRSMIASIAGGCVFGLGGYVGHTGWPQMLNGAVWAPLVFMYLLRVRRGERPVASAALAGFFLGVAWLSGHHQVPLLLTLAAAGTWVWLWVAKNPFSRRGAKNAENAKRSFPFCWPLAVFAIGMLASGLQTIPAAEHASHSVRWSEADHPLHFNEAVPYSVHQKYSFNPLSLLGILVPGIDNYVDPHIGVAALAFALLGIAAAWRDRAVRYLATLALAAVVFALGGHSVFHGFFYAVIPMVEKARVPGAALAIFAAASAPLVAFGIDSIPGNLHWSRRGAWVLGAVGAILLAAAIQLSMERVTSTAICALLMAAVLAAWSARRLSSFAGAAAALVLILFELSNVTNYYLPETGDPAQTPNLHRMAAHADLVEFVRNQGTQARVEYDADVIPYNIGDWYGLETFDTYTVSMAENIARQDLYSTQLREFFGIRYAFLKAARRPDQRELFRGRSGIAVFENPRAFPHVWTVHETTSATREEGRTLLANSPFDALHKVFFTDGPGPALARCHPSGESVQMPHHEPNQVTVEARMNCRGMVILTDAWESGWHATVDGKPARIEEAYGTVRGVVVDTGEHTIEMRYRPWSVIVGAAMTLLATIVVAVINRRSS